MPRCVRCERQAVPAPGRTCRDCFVRLNVRKLQEAGLVPYEYESFGDLHHCRRCKQLLPAHRRGKLCSSCFSVVNQVPNTYDQVTIGAGLVLKEAEFLAGIQYKYRNENLRLQQAAEQEALAPKLRQEVEDES